MIDKYNNIYITGSTESYGAGEGDVFLTCFNSTGDLLWNRTWGNENYDYGIGIALDNSQNIYITGAYNDTSSENYNAFLLKYNSSGALQWNKTWGREKFDCAYDIVIDNLDLIYVTGITKCYGEGNSDAFLACYNTSGDLQWFIPSNIIYDKKIPPSIGLPSLLMLSFAVSVGIIYILIDLIKKIPKMFAE